MKNSSSKSLTENKLDKRWGIDTWNPVNYLRWTMGDYSLKERMLENKSN
jgi:hypothetical protein